MQNRGVVAACTFLLLVEPHGGAFGVTPGAQHRPVEVERDAREPLGHQALDDHRRRFDADVADAAFVGTAERVADGGHVGQSLQAEHSLDQLIITVVLEVSQSSMSDDEMHDQQHHHDVVTVDWVGLQVAEASQQPLLDANEGEEVLKENESRVRGQILCLESDLHAQRGFTSNLGFPKFHLWSPFHLVRRRFATMIVPDSETTSLFSHSFSSPKRCRWSSRFRGIRGSGLASQMVNLSYMAHGTGNHSNIGLSGLSSRNFLQLTGQWWRLYPSPLNLCIVTHGRVGTSIGRVLHQHTDLRYPIHQSSARSTCRSVCCQHTGLLRCKG